LVPWQEKDQVTFAMGDAMVPAGTTLERKRPVGQPSQEHARANVLYVIGSFSVFFLGGAIIAVLLWEFNVFVWATFLGVLVAAVLWFALIWANQRLLWQVETLTGRDLNKDNSVGEPETVVVEVWQKDDRGVKQMNKWELSMLVRRFLGRSFVIGGGS
jgi:hypothetical protein